MLSKWRPAANPRRHPLQPRYLNPGTGTVMANWFRRSPRSSSSKHRRASYRPTFEGLEDRSLLAAPVINPINNVVANIPVTKTLFVPVTGSDADNDALTYTVSSSNPDITAEVRTSA